MLKKNDCFDFDEVVKNRIELINKILKKKEKEYSNNIDRFHNFHTAARISNCTPENTLWGMLVKHIVSVMDIITTCEMNIYSKEYIEEKIGDTINYFILLEGLLKYRYKY